MDIEQLKKCKAEIRIITENYIYNLHNLICEVNDCDDDSEVYKKAKESLPYAKKEIENLVQEVKVDFGEKNDLPRTEFFPIYALFNALIEHPDDENIAFDIEEALDELIKKYE